MTMKLCLICQMNGVAFSQLIHTVENAWKNNLNSVQSWIWNIMKSQKAKHPFHHTLKLKACHFTFWPRDRNALKEGKSDRTKSERLLWMRGWHRRGDRKTLPLCGDMHSTAQPLHTRARPRPRHTRRRTRRRDAKMDKASSMINRPFSILGNRQRHPFCTLHSLIQILLTASQWCDISHLLILICF